MADKTRRLYMACAFAVTLLFSLGNTTQGTLLTEFAEHYGIGTLPQSFISAAASFGMAASLLLLLSGLIRITKNALFVVAVAMLGGALGLIGTMPAFPVFIALYALLGVSFGFIDAIGSSLIADVSAPDTVGRNMGMLHAFYGIGGILGPLLIRATASFAAGSGKGGAGAAAFLLSAFGAALFVFNLYTYRSVRRYLPAAVKYPERPRAAGLSAFLRSGAVPLLLICGLNGVYINIITFRTAQYVTVEFGSSVLGALAVSTFWAGTVISRFTIPRMRLNFRAYLVGSLLGTGALTALGVLLGSAYSAIAAVFLAGLISGAVTPLCMGELCMMVPENTLLGSVSALLSQYVVSLTGTLLAGALTPNDMLGAGLYFAAGYSALGAIAGAFYKKNVG